MRSLLNRRAAVMLSAIVLVGGAAAVVAPNALAASTSSPAITWATGSPSVNGSTATVGFSVNRQTKAVSSCTYTIDGGKTNSGCGSSTTGAKDPAAYSVTLGNLTNATYTFTVNIRLTDGGRVTAATSFVVSVNPCLESFLDYQRDARLTGPLNTLNNLTLYSSYDGSCAAPSGYSWTVVQASSQDAANQECFALAGWIQGSAIDGYYDLPDDYYWCNSIGA